MKETAWPFKVQDYNIACSGIVNKVVFTGDNDIPASSVIWMTTKRGYRACKTFALGHAIFIPAMALLYLSVTF